MFVHFTRMSRNSKTGPIPVSTTSRDTCPDACPFKRNGCYADSGPLRFHWDRVSAGERTLSWRAFLDAIKALPRLTLWRHNQAGDLPGAGDAIDAAALDQLATANRKRRGFTYTHKPMTPDNIAAVSGAIAKGFVINLSANSLAHADELKALGVAPVVAVVPRAAPLKGKTPAGNAYVVCPAQFGDANCSTCGMCANADTKRPIIAFHAHGNGARKVEAIVATNQGAP